MNLNYHEFHVSAERMAKTDKAFASAYNRRNPETRIEEFVKFFQNVLLNNLSKRTNCCVSGDANDIEVQNVIRYFFMTDNPDPKDVKFSPNETPISSISSKTSSSDKSSDTKKKKTSTKKQKTNIVHFDPVVPASSNNDDDDDDDWGTGLFN